MTAVWLVITNIAVMAIALCVVELDRRLRRIEARERLERVITAEEWNEIREVWREPPEEPLRDGWHQD